MSNTVVIESEDPLEVDITLEAPNTVEVTYSGAQGPAAVPVNAGVLSLASGVSTATITFDTEMPNVNYVVHIAFENSVDADPIFLLHHIYLKTVEEFSIRMNAPTDSANYKINWSARRV